MTHRAPVDPQFEAIHRARERLRGQARVTPVLTCAALDERAGARVFLKCESFQRCGVFKFRGAYNAVAALDPGMRARGVITHSSGNHAQALALAGRLLGAPVTVVMPIGAPAVKRAAVESYGASIIEYDPARAERESISRQIAAERDLLLVPPFDHPEIIAGQGTAALEFLEEVGVLDAMLAPCGGGGLLSGTAISVKHMCPSCRVIGVEPAQADDATRSFKSGRLQRIDRPLTIADGLRTPSLGTLTFPLIRRFVDDMTTVSEDAIAEAVRFLFHRVKIVVEPSGAVALAAVLGGQVRGAARVGVIVSGGNIDGATMARILTG
jgi:threonine dehydratase